MSCHFAGELCIFDTTSPAYSDLFTRDKSLRGKQSQALGQSIWREEEEMTQYKNVCYIRFANISYNIQLISLIVLLLLHIQCRSIKHWSWVLPRTFLSYTNSQVDTKKLGTERSSAMELHDTAARLYDVKSLLVDAISVISVPDASKIQAKAAISTFQFQSKRVEESAVEKNHTHFAYK